MKESSEVFRQEQRKIMDAMKTEHQKLFHANSNMACRIAALELALNKHGAHIAGCKGGIDFPRSPCTCGWDKVCDDLDGSKLGELFQALLEEHKREKEPEGWYDWRSKVEALRKEVGL